MMLKKFTLFFMMVLGVLLSAVSFALSPLQVGESMASTRLIPLLADPYISSLRVRAPPELALQRRGLMTQQATISINYLAAGPGSYGDNCITWPNQAKAAFNYAASLWASQLQSAVPISIDACWANNLGSGILGHGGPTGSYRDFSGAPVSNTWYPIPLANALHGSDLDPDQADIYIAYSSTFSWYLGTDGNTPFNQYDLVSVVLHEITHGLGFLGSMMVLNGQGSWGGGSGYPYIYDRFTENGSGQKLIDTTWFPNPSAVLATQLLSGDIYFNGAYANAGNGGEWVPLYAPWQWSEGSSYAHLAESYNNTANALMTYSLSFGESIHAPGPVTLGLLKDTGWALSTSNPAAVSNLIFSGDYNGDRRADLIWRHETTGQVYGVLLDGYSIVQQGMVYTESNTAWRIVSNGDFNGDGRDELLWWNNQTGQVYQMPMNGLNIAGGAQIYQEPNTAWQIVAVGDLNGDSKDDLIWWNNSSGQVYGMVMNGSGIAQGGMIYQEANTAWRILATRDFNADGNADLLWRNTTTGQVYLMPMNGLSIAGGAMVYHEPNLAWSIVAVGDLNGDRKADLVWWNSQTGQVYGMLMNGPGIAQGAMLYQEPNTAWQIIASGDYTGDGKADLLWRNGTTGQVYEMVMSGLSIAGGAQIYQEANPNWRILATAAEVPHLPSPGADSAPLTGNKPINAYQSFEGALSNPSQSLSGAPLNSSVLPATE